ncbi:MAG: phosphotransferase [Gammaproteobacteria bacterium]|nr:MAG: phosphotransferase [Gammaproteobacteria bacterium]
MDSRLEQLKTWLIEILGTSVFTLTPASADASFRRYFRVVVDGPTYIAMDAPPDKEALEPFCRIARRWRDTGLNVPEIFHRNDKQGFLLLSDLGNKVYLDQLRADNADMLYADAMASLCRLQVATTSQENFLPPYDAVLLDAEMQLFPDWYLMHELGASLTTEQSSSLAQVFALLRENALVQPRVWVHRDYHSRNLMVTNTQSPGILDFQDAVLGPVTYDLVSLLKDCYIAWPRERVLGWVRDYYSRIKESGVPVSAGVEEFIRWFDLMGVQRHLKATGIFARLYHRDSKPGYLNDIPRILAYIEEVGQDYPEVRPLVTLLSALKSG